MRPKVGLFSRRTGGGHFDTFRNNVSELLTRCGQEVAIIPSSKAASSWPDVLVVLDADYSRAELVKLLMSRLLRMRRTICLMWRSPRQEPSQNSLRLKQFFYNLVTLIPQASLMYVVSGRSSHAYRHDEIVDSEYWDLDGLNAQTAFGGALGDDVAAALYPDHPRMTVLAIGGLRQEKGAQFLLDAWSTNPELAQRCRLVIAGIGENISELDNYVDQGIVRIPRRLSDAEWMALVAASDAVWACYSPLYDRSSGVAGRALQMGKWLLVRKSSLLEREVGSYSKAVALPFDDGERFVDAIDALSLKTNVRSNYSVEPALNHTALSLQRIIAGEGI